MLIFQGVGDTKTWKKATTNTAETATRARITRATNSNAATTISNNSSTSNNTRNSNSINSNSNRSNHKEINHNDDTQDDHESNHGHSMNCYLHFAVAIITSYDFHRTPVSLCLKVREMARSPFGNLHQVSPGAFVHCLKRVCRLVSILTLDSAIFTRGSLCDDLFCENLL